MGVATPPPCVRGWGGLVVGGGSRWGVFNLDLLVGGGAGLGGRDMGGSGELGGRHMGGREHMMQSSLEAHHNHST